MTRAAALLLVLLAVPAAASAAELTLHDGPSAPALQWKAAMERGDLAALARMHDEGTRAYPPDKVETDGASAIIAGYAALFAANTVQIEFDDAHWIAVPPLVVSWGRTTLVLHPRSGGPDTVARTRFTDAAVAVPGGWRYVIDHASRPVPAERPPERAR